jgi:hypothetical protein
MNTMAMAIASTGMISIGFTMSGLLQGRTRFSTLERLISFPGRPEISGLIAMPAPFIAPA